MQATVIKNDEGLPAVCMKCGDAASIQRHYRFGESDAAWNLVFGSVIGWAFAKLLGYFMRIRTGNDQSFRVVLCERCQNQKFVRESLGPALVVLIAGAVVTTVVLAVTGYWFVLLCLLPFLGCTIGLVYYLQSTVIEVRDVGATGTTFVGLSADFVRELQRARRSEFASVIAQMEDAG